MLAMPRISHHPLGVTVNGRLFLRDEYYATDRVRLREWVALGVLIFGLAAWAVLTIGGIAWVIWMVLHR
jgi:uncharacterized membrane protein (GlpM family)